MEDTKVCIILRKKVLRGNFLQDILNTEFVGPKLLIGLKSSQGSMTKIGIRSTEEERLMFTLKHGDLFLIQTIEEFLANNDALTLNKMDDNT